MMKQLAIAAAMAAVSTSAMAAEATINATISLALPVGVGGGENNYGNNLPIPSIGDSTFRMSPSGVVSQISAADSSQFVDVAGSPNVLTLRGMPNASVPYISVSETETGGAASLVDGSATLSAVSAVLDANGYASVTVGADVTITAAAAAGNSVGTITLTANY